MTIKELANFTGKDERTIQRWLEKTCDILSDDEKQTIKEKITTSWETKKPADYSLNEIEKILNHSSLSKDNIFILMENARSTSVTKTSLEKELIIQQALIFQAEKIKVLSIKAQVADKIANTTGLLLPSSVGKLISGEPNKFCQWLVSNKVMFRKGSNDSLMPYSQYDKKYFQIKISTYRDKSTFQSYFTPRGVLWIQAKYLKKNDLLQLDYSENV